MKYGIISIIVFSFAGLLLSSFKTTETVESKTNQWYAVKLETLQSRLETFAADTKNEDTAAWKKDFLACREYYKQVEFIVAYYYPFAEQRMNGPAVYEVEPSDFSEINFPSGFQVIEESLFSDEIPVNKKKVLDKQIAYLLSYVALLKKQQPQLALSGAALYDALRCNLYAIAAKGISAFDAPSSANALHEAITTIATTKEVLFLQGPISKELAIGINRSLAFLKTDPDNVDGFDRAIFLRSYFGPLLKALYHQQVQLHIPFVQAKSAVRKDAQSFLEAGAFDPYFFAGDSIPVASASVVALGARLFSEGSLSLGGRSCAGCHKPELAYTDGLPQNKSLQRDEMIRRNTPTLLNAALQPVLFYDARAASLEQQAHDVLYNKDEMDGYLEKAIDGFKKNNTYQSAFAKAFPGPASISQEHIIAALVAFERSLVKLDAPFDRYMRGDSLAMTWQQVKGFNLFMGKAKCGTCHYMPLFNGVVPPFYTRSDTEILGTPESPENVRPDKDPGAYAYYHNEVKRGAFKTPTLRNAALTAPYMHNGKWKTLESVIDFYDEGGGLGLGLEVPHQTLSPEKLHLSIEDKQNLIAFIKALNDN